jgi:hypothetical protein
MTDRQNLEWLVYYCLNLEEPVITSSRGKKLLNLKTMEEMKDWYNEYHKKVNRFYK